MSSRKMSRLNTVCGLALVSFFFLGSPAIGDAPEGGTAVPGKRLVAAGEDLRNESFGARRIVRIGDISYIGYSQLMRGKWRIRIKTLDHQTGALSDPVDICPGTDDHSVMSLVADAKGKLHCVSGGHGALKYVRTARPGDMNSWTSPEQIGTGTYPMLMVDRNDGLFLFYRAYKQTDLAMQTRPADGEWSEPAIVGRTSGPVFYIMGTAMGNEKGRQSLHVAGHFYGSPAEYGKPWPEEAYGYRIIPWYICSRDGGRTWEKAGGETIGLPVDEKSVDILFDSDEPYDIPWSVDIALDPDNRPHVFCAFSARRPAPGMGLRAVQNEIGKSPSRLTEFSWDGRRWIKAGIETPGLKGTHFSHPTAVFSDGTFHVAAAFSRLETARPRSEDPTGGLLHLRRRNSGPWREELLDENCAYANWKLPDRSGELEIMWRGKSPDGESAIYYRRLSGK